MTEDTENRSTTGWIVGIVVVAAIIGLLLFARGPEDQDRSGAMAPAAVITTGA
jgi:hypothetical protein